MGKIFLANGNQKRAGVAKLTSEKMHIKLPKILTQRDEEQYYIIIKGVNLPGIHSNYKYVIYTLNTSGYTNV